MAHGRPSTVTSERSRSSGVDISLARAYSGSLGPWASDAQTCTAFFKPQVVLLPAVALAHRDASIFESVKRFHEA